MSNNPIPYINIPVHGNNQLIMNAIYSDLNNNYYWSDNFSPNLYIFLAQAGFISTSTYIENFGDILLPEIQKSYAV
ncbi:MAG: hypothetical protein JXR64_10130, partial [Spirochaetales bacterium]|nr:hypothetical protein [Spirochaetales bacterium]